MFRFSPLFFIAFVTCSILVAFGIHTAQKPSAPVRSIANDEEMMNRGVVPPNPFAQPSPAPTQSEQPQPSAHSANETVPQEQSQEGTSAPPPSSPPNPFVTDSDSPGSVQEATPTPALPEVPPAQPVSEGEAIQMIDVIRERIQSFTNPQAYEAEKCQCTATNSSQYFEYEEAERCTGQRKVYENVISKLPPVFREERAKKPAEFERACLLYIMNKHMGSNDAGASPSLAKCSNPNGQPSPGGSKPCVTRSYVNAIYNSFADVADCMGLPQKDYIPKLYNESGWHMNALFYKDVRDKRGKLIKITAANAGIGQLTTNSLIDSNKIFNEAKAEVLANASEKESCKNIAPLIEKMRPSPETPANRCGIMMGSESPLRHFFYIALHHRKSQEYIDIGIRDLNIHEKFKKVGMTLSADDEVQLKQILYTLGYNTGARSAVNLLNTYLTGAAKAKRKLTKADFDFSQPLPSGMRRIPANKRSFPVYAAIFQQAGTDGYVSKVAEKAQDLNTAFKGGTCVPNSYLAL